MKYFAGALFFLVHTSFLFAQDTLLVQPEKQFIDGSFIESYTNRWKVFVTDSTGNENLVRIWFDYAQILEQDGVNYIHRVQDLYNPQYELEATWINVIEHKTLLPKRFSSHTSTGNLSLLDFRKDKIISSSNQNKGQKFETNIYEINESVYDWNLYGILLAGLSFESDAVFRVPFWDQKAKKVGSIIAEVDGSETVSTISGEEIATLKFYTDKRLTFWLTKTKPYVIQLKLEMTNGSIMTWKMF